MKVVILNGSPRKFGNSDLFIAEMVRVFQDKGVETEVIRIGGQGIRGCLACGYCAKNKGCVIDDLVNQVGPKVAEASGLVVVSPVYFASPNGDLISFLDRLFHSHQFDARMKVGASFAIARRGGTETTFDVLNKYFTISGMPVVSGDYWNNGFAGAKGEIAQDEEGLRNARIVAKRMSFLMKAIEDEKEKDPSILEDEARAWTNFIR